MKQKLTILAAIFASTALSLTAVPRETVVMDKIWDAKPAEQPEPLPGNDDWGKFRFDRNWLGISGFDLRNVKSKPPKPLKEYNSAWYRQTVKIPESWNGSTVRFQVPIQYSDMLVYVNGKRAGEILKPAGEVDISSLLKYGSDNQIQLFQTRDYSGISRKTEAYSARPNWQFGFQELPFVSKTGNVYFDDVFANPSFRKKQLNLETEIMAKTPGIFTVSAQILDADGKIVKTAERKITLKKGLTPLSLEIPWKDPKCWEINAPYLYQCRIKIIGADGKTLDDYPVFPFGFREIWRDGKEMYMNGHIQRIRPVYGFGIKEHGVSFFRMIGYNAIDLSEKHYNFSSIDKKLLKKMDETGTVCFAGMPSINYMRDKMRKDPAAIAEYERYSKLMMRKYRNHPSIFAWCVGMNTNCPIWNIDPEKFAQIEGYAAQDKNINAACDIGRKFSPGTLFYSHADGSNGDISTNNIYLNLTPIQEREEWVSQWAEKGIYPWLGAEFGEPYVANFWQKKNFLFTEYMAIFYGEKAYEKESEKAQTMIVPLSLANRNGHADGCVGLDTEFPLFWDFKRDITWRTNRAWRTFGINGGMLYFNLREAYGMPPPGGAPYQRYGRINKEVTAKPEWANDAFDIHQLGNKDFLGYLGGAPKHTDKTHAFYSGESVDKQIVFVWDGPGKKNFSAKWDVTLNGKVIAQGNCEKSMATGDVKFQKLTFQMPRVESKTSLKLNAEFFENGKSVFKDSFDMQVYPKRKSNIKVSGEVAVLDPSGKAQEILKYYGIPFRTIKNTDETGSAKFLIFGKNALDNAALGFSRKNLKNGLRVLILAQNPDAWRALGFKVMDSMSRQVFLRDKTNPVFKDLTDDVLSNWRGAPVYGKKPYGAIMAHDAQRGPRWTRTHTVAGLMLQIPERSGFVPLIDGEFDLNYAAFLRWSYGKGGIDYCTLDFEDRVPSDPLAEMTARAVLTDFFNSKAQTSRSVYADGAAAFDLLRKTGSDVSAFAKASDPGAALCVIGSDSKLGWDSIKTFAEKGGNVIVLDNQRLVKDAGLNTVSKKIYRAGADEKGLFKNVGQSLLRWRDAVEASLIQPSSGVEVYADGMFASLKIGKGTVLFGQINPDFFAKRHAKDELKRTATALSTEHLVQLYARLITNLGGLPGDKVADRLMYQAGSAAFAPLKYFFVLGPFKCPVDDSKKMLNTAFPGEDMAIAGDNNPNPRFKLPQGGEVDWRPMISPDENGFVNLNKLNPLYSDVNLSVSYAIAYFKREQAGPAILKFGVDWRAKIWCNGTPVFYTESGSRGYKFETKVNLKKGDNYLTFKIGSGSNGNGFWALLSQETPKNAVQHKNIKGLNDVKLYENSIEGYDPYTFHYW